MRSFRHRVSSAVGYLWGRLRAESGHGWDTGARAGPLSPPGRRERVLPFIAVYAVGVIAAALLAPDGVSPTGLTVAAGSVGVVAFTSLAIPWQRLPRWTQLAPPLLMVLSAGALGDLAGGPVSGVTLLLLVPIVWMALFGSGVEVAITAAAAALALLGPLWLPTNADYVVLDELGPMVIFAVVVGGLVLLIRRGRRSVLTDPLTGLANRRAWDAALAREMERARRSGEPLCVRALDLDHFKAFNDRHGHAGGDRHLIEATRVWQGALRTYDTLARLGGEEFGVILPDTAPGAAQVIVHRLARGTPNDGTVSAGIAVWDGKESAAALLDRADGALYEAKRAGRARVVTSRRDASRPACWAIR